MKKLSTDTGRRNNRSIVPTSTTTACLIIANLTQMLSCCIYIYPLLEKDAELNEEITTVFIPYKVSQLFLSIYVLIDRLFHIPLSGDGVLL